MTTLVGEKFVVGMIGTLCDALESEYGIFIPRLYRIFRPAKGLGFFDNDESILIPGPVNWRIPL